MTAFGLSSPRGYPINLNDKVEPMLVQVQVSMNAVSGQLAG